MTDRSPARRPALLLLLAGLLPALLGGCLFGPRWHWERPGADPAAYDADEKFCKQQSYSGTDGMVTQAQVRRMHGCLEARGWRKVGP